MNVNINKVKIIVTVPLKNVEEVRNSVCNAGAGVIGNYTHCSMSTKCIGTFKPNDNANPYIGENNKLEFVEEENILVLEKYANISEKEKIEIKSLKRGESLMFIGDNHILAKIEASDEERELI